MSEKKKKDLRNAAARARDAWMNTKDFAKSCNPLTLQAPPSQGQYLRNRLELAFIAGWDAAKKDNENAPD